MARRSASDAIKGAAATVAPDAPEEAATAATAPEAQDAPETAPAPDQDALGDMDGWDGTVEVTVIIDQFHYFDEDGAHLSARKGETVELYSEDAERAVRIGAAQASE